MVGTKNRVRSTRQFVWIAGFLCLACAPPGQYDASQIEGEARAFMEGYAVDLLNHDAVAISNRYDRRGAYLLGHGAKAFEPFDSVRERYTERWQGPADFEWHDLSFEVLSNDAVVVAGRFSWTADDGIPPLSGSYTGLLVRQEGELRIRLEDESFDPATAPDMTRQSEPSSQ